MSVKLQPRKRVKKSPFRSRALIVTLAVLVLVVGLITYVMFAPRPPVHDVAVAHIDPWFVAVPQGFDINISVTVDNRGSFTESCNVNVSVPTNASVKMFTQSAEGLPAGEVKVLTFVWSTAGLSLGDYRINASVSRVENESDISDNSLFTVLTLSNRVLMQTSMGNFTIELFDDMPITTANFKKLVWTEVYDGTIFHRVVHGFVVQGGDPTGTGQGDPSIPTIPDELPNKHSNIAMAVAMAKKSEPNSASSQFYVNLADNSRSLDGNYTVFGHVIVGADVVLEIGRVQTDTDAGTGDADKPTTDVLVYKAEFTK